MKQIAKWVVIAWSVFCLIGVFVGLANMGNSMQGPTSDAERTGQALGMGCGMAMWVGIWAAVGLPALIIYIVSGRSQAQQALPPAPPPTPARLCSACGRYYEGHPKFCPNCGAPAA